MLVDCHMHYFEYPDFYVMSNLANVFPEVASLSDEELVKRFHRPIEPYLKEMEGVVDKAIIMSINYPDSFARVTTHDEVARTVRQHPDKLAWCCCVNPTEKGAVEEFERCVRELGAVGMGEWGPAYMFVATNDERCFPIYEKAIELDVPIVIHAGPALLRTSRLKYANIFDIDEVAIRYPELKIVICHVGFPKYEEAIFLMQKHPNVFADISWLSALSGLDFGTPTAYSRPEGMVVDPYFHLLYPLLYYFSGAYGAASSDKLIFGTDYPAAMPGKYVDILTNINELTAKFNLPEIPQQTIQNILHENWKKVFKL